MEMSRLLKILLVINLIIIAVLAFVYPHLMVGPGKLIPAHMQFKTDCFACHSPFTGAESERCVACHKPSEIGMLTSKGLKIAKPLTSKPFHQQLISSDCIGCHSDHAGVTRYKQHGHFNHSFLKEEIRQNCQDCHKVPNDSLHLKITGNCSQCHSQDKWLPATFDHDKYFVLDGNHSTRCATCHVRDDYKRYTCYGCHEHSQSNIRSNHIEEGIRDFDNCVKCHRSANEEDVRSGEGSSEERD
jgi:hypothetical protein